MVRRTVTDERPTKKRKTSIAKASKSDIKAMISSLKEKKFAITEYENIVINRGPGGALDVRTNPNFFKILPDIEQSVTGNAGRAINTRVGNEITLKSLDINGYVSYNGDGVQDIDLKNGKLAVRVMLLRAKEINDTDVLFENMPGAALLRWGTQIGGPAGVGTRSFGGFSLDPFRAINRDAFSVRHDEVIYLDAPTFIPGNNLQGDSAFSAVPTGAQLFRHKLTFGKNGLKLKYTNSTDNMANNFPYFLVMGYGSMSSGDVPDQSLVRVSLQCTSQFTDS